jgi:hypothetical protein
MGSCFHQALSRWALLRDEGETGWKIALAIVVPVLGRDRHLHAWLQHGERCLMVVDGTPMQRDAYYEFMGVERDTVRLVNPRHLLRNLRGSINRNTISDLLNLSGLPWTSNELGGIVPVSVESSAFLKRG